MIYLEKEENGHNIVFQIFERLFHGIGTTYAVWFWGEKLGS